MRDGRNKLRIIAGEWRGRKIPVLDLPGLRPTTDRIRETLFNWLAPELAGRHCLDLFAGSGALGLEALSRGAARCQFVERDRYAAKALQQVLVALTAQDRGQVKEADARSFLDTGAGERRFDLVFVDPPFEAELLDTTLAQLEDGDLLSENALVYVEYATSTTPRLPADWECWRSKQSANVCYEVYRTA